ncbi:MAG: glycosyltransferase family 2 protein [Pseudomonadota bacterium]
MFDRIILKKNKKVPKPHLHDIIRAPYVVSQKGKPQAAVKVDQLQKSNGIYRVEGWLSSYERSPTIEIWVNNAPIAISCTFHERQDVSSSMKDTNPDLESQGFCIEWSEKPEEGDAHLLVCQLEEETSPLFFTLPGREYFNEAPQAVPYKEVESVIKQAKNSGAMTDFLNDAVWQTPDPLKAVAHIDSFGLIPARCGLMAGWMVAQPGWEMWGVDSQCNVLNLASALRYQREDIVSLFRDTFGQRTVDAGFVMQWPHSISMSDTVGIVAYHPESKRAFEVARKQAVEVPNEPEGYARWAFTVATPAEKFNDRLNGWEGELIETLLAERSRAFSHDEKAPDVMVLGKVPDSPDISLIIPLYSRWDFVEHQLLAFSKDATLLETTEIIYVVDDPRILTAISNEVENLHRLYNVPFKVVWGHRNRGFSGANNLGVSVSRGRQVLLLNSDAFPTSPGWANQLSTLLDENPQYGLLGARLLNPEGGLQHAGMVFFYSQSWQVWLNKHPLAGLAPELDDVPEGAQIVDKPAVTGACVIMQRSLYDQLGGLDEGYLIGDFEDSDLCLKVLSEGYQLGYVPEVSLVHLERQSFSSLGDTSFRTLVVRFNAWRHTKRWGKQIQSVMQSFS